VLTRFDWIQIQVPPGTALRDAVEAAIEIANNQRVLVRLDFNGAPLAVAMDSDVEEIVARYAGDYSHLGSIQE
jgi:sugar/nucleoside kinase (ribokinase family)